VILHGTYGKTWVSLVLPFSLSCQHGDTLTSQFLDLAKFLRESLEPSSPLPRRGPTPTKCDMLG